jgi:hypothetical protein
MRYVGIRTVGQDDFKTAVDLLVERVTLDPFFVNRQRTPQVVDSQRGPSGSIIMGIANDGRPASVAPGEVEGIGRFGQAARRYEQPERVQLSTARPE